MVMMIEVVMSAVVVVVAVAVAALVAAEISKNVGAKWVCLVPHTQ